MARIFANMESLQRQIEAAGKAIPILPNVVESYRVALLQGNADVLTYYNARSELTTKRLELIDLKRQLADLHIALEIATGRYLEPREKEANPNETRALELLIIVALAVGIGWGYWWISSVSRPSDLPRKHYCQGESSKNLSLPSRSRLYERNCGRRNHVYGTVVPAAGAVQTFQCRLKAVFVIFLSPKPSGFPSGDALLEIEPSPDTSLQTQQARNDYESAKKALDYMQQRFDLKLATNDQLLQAKQHWSRLKQSLKACDAGEVKALELFALMLRD